MLQDRRAASFADSFTTGGWESRDDCNDERIDAKFADNGTGHIEVGTGINSTSSIGIDIDVDDKQETKECDVESTVEASSDRLSRGERFSQQFADIFDGYGYGVLLFLCNNPLCLNGLCQ